MKHWADGYRVYDGCPDSTMQRRLDAEAALLKQLESHVPEVRITYFPMEERYMAHVWGVALTGFCSSRVEAIELALNPFRES